jgi:uncharacterized membrane protein
MAVPDKVKFITKRLRERLWVKPLAFCILSIAAVFIAKAADHMNLDRNIPSVTTDSIEALLAILGASMLVIATFAVASMVSAYASASSSATPRSFTLIIADDVSQNALSTFVGAFIFSVVALTAAKNDFFQEPGLAALFVLTVVVFGVVILTFVRWVDQIARLGRLGASVEKVEAATAAAMRHRRAAPAFCGMPAKRRLPQGHRPCMQRPWVMCSTSISQLCRPGPRRQTDGWPLRLSRARLPSLGARWPTWLTMLTTRLNAT